MGSLQRGEAGVGGRKDKQLPVHKDHLMWWKANAHNDHANIYQLPQQRSQRVII